MYRNAFKSALGFIRPEIPTLVPGPPSGEGWIHEIKDDGYRTLIVIDRARSAPSPEMAMIGRAYRRVRSRSFEWTG